MRYLSVCSGVEAATVAWHHMGWQAAGFSEIEKFPSEVLAHHYPSVTNFGDMTKYKEWNLNDPIGLLVGGTPCQSFSVAGLRKGLDDPRGNLALTYLGILDHLRPKWCVWENVPGVLSSGGGRDFGALLGALGELGYGFAYRVLDAQNFGVAQRRRRVFVVGCLGDWESAAKVLFEPESLSGNTEQSRKARKGIASYVESSFGQYREDVISGTIKASGGVAAGGSETLYVPDVANCLQTTCDDYSRADGFNMIAKVYENHPSDFRINETNVSPTVRARWGTGGGNTPYVHAIPIHDQATRFNGTNNGKGNGLGIGVAGDPMPTLDTSSRHATFHNMTVRRLTPVECERLQGFPDNYTNIKDKCPDGPRYKAMGNSMAVPVMRWIGERINKVNSLL